MNRFSDFEFDDDYEACAPKQRGMHPVSIDTTDADNVPAPREVLEEIAWILIGALTIGVASSLILQVGF